MPRPRWLVAAATLGVASAVVLAGCGTSTTGSEPTSPAATGPGAVAADPAWGHVHNLLLDGDVLLIGTHEGLWRQADSQPAQLVSQPPFDVMGLARSGKQLLASGHPGEGQDLPSDLGLVASGDGGVSWAPVSLSGEVDFHRLVAAGAVRYGIGSGGGQLLRSDDEGWTWNDLGTPPLFDLAVDPTGPARVVGTTADGPVLSTDHGRTFAPLPEAPLVALLSWTGRTLYAVAPDGVVYRSQNPTGTWQRVGQVSGQPGAITAAGRRVVVLAGDTVVESRDGGATFTPRITGVPAH